MRAYLSPDGFQLLADAQSQARLNSLRITGYTVGSQSNFVPSNAMNVAQGNLLVDKRTSPKSVRITPLHNHEIIISLRMDQNLEFPAVGNILFYLDNKPFLWSVAGRDLPKVATDGKTHFAGDDYYFPVVFRYPFITTLLIQSANTYDVANFPIFNDMEGITVPAHTLCEQIQVDNNSYPYGQGNPFIANRIDQEWRAMPLFQNLKDGLRYIDGGTTKSGQ